MPYSRVPLLRGFSLWREFGRRPAYGGLVAAQNIRLVHRHRQEPLMGGRVSDFGGTVRDSTRSSKPRSSRSRRTERLRPAPQPTVLIVEDETDLRILAESKNGSVERYSVYHLPAVEHFK